jgi:uncharacterized protein YegP (UPF0339 family)
MRFEVYLARNRQWRWRLRAKNGRLIANAGESYHHRTDCMKAINLIRHIVYNTPIEFLTKAV